MALDAELTANSLVRPIETWVWPLTAAIVLGGTILFWSLAGLFWIATHPAEKSVVIWLASPDDGAFNAQFSGQHASKIAAEGPRDERAN